MRQTLKDVYKKAQDFEQLMQLSPVEEVVELQKSVSHVYFTLYKHLSLILFRKRS